MTTTTTTMTITVMLVRSVFGIVAFFSLALLVADHPALTLSCQLRRTVSLFILGLLWLQPSG